MRREPSFESMEILSAAQTTMAFSPISGSAGAHHIPLRSRAGVTPAPGVDPAWPMVGGNGELT